VVLGFRVQIIIMREIKIVMGTALQRPFYWRVRGESSWWN